MRSRVQLSDTNSLVLAGEEDVTSWDDEELAEGRRRDKNGKFGGATPKLVPMAVVREQQRRSHMRAQSILAPAAVEALTVLREIVHDGAVEPGDKIKAAMYLVDRGLGKEPIRVDAYIESRIETVARGMVIDDRSSFGDDIVGAEVVEPGSGST